MFSFISGSIRHELSLPITISIEMGGKNKLKGCRWQQQLPVCREQYVSPSIHLMAYCAYS